MFIIDGCQSQLFSMFSCILYDISALNNNIFRVMVDLILRRPCTCNIHFYLYVAFVYKVNRWTTIHTFTYMYKLIHAMNENHNYNQLPKTQYEKGYLKSDKF